MENTNDQQDVVTNETETEEVEEVEETETTDWKAEALKAQGIAKRLKTKLEKSKEPKSDSRVEKAEAQTAVTRSNELDSGQKALLVAYGVKGKDELALAQSYMQRTGDDIDAIIEDDIFQAKLGKLREAKATRNAVPSGTRSSTTNTKDSIDFHLEKYESGQMKLSEMPFEMRKQVLQKALEKKENENKFKF